MSGPTPEQKKGFAHNPSRARKALVLSLMAIWLAFQVLFPLRHLLYPGYASWTEEGRKFAWQMKLRDKKVRASFLVRDRATLVVQQVQAEDYLRPHQVRKMVRRPEMILQFAHHLADIAKQQGIDQLEVWARVCVSLNGRREAWLIDPYRDLVQVHRSWRSADWIRPLEHPPERPPNPRGRENLRCELSGARE